MNKYFNMFLAFIFLIIIAFIFPISLNFNIQPIDCEQIIKDNPNSTVICDDFGIEFIDTIIFILPFLFIITIIFFIGYCFIPKNKEKKEK